MARASNAGNPAIITTQPAHILRHSISDEELDMLCDSKSDLSLEFLLVGVGGAVGTLPTALATISNHFLDKGSEITTVDFISLTVFISSCLLAGSMFFVHNRKSTKSLTLRDQIRARTDGDSGSDAQSA